MSAILVRSFWRNGMPAYGDSFRAEADPRFKQIGQGVMIPSLRKHA